MNSVGRMIMQAKMNEREDRLSRDRRDMERDRSRNDRTRDSAYDRERDRMRDRDFDDDDFEMDGRRGVKGTGRGRYRDRGETLCLTKFDIARWSKMLKNADGTTGKHFDMREVEEAAHHLGIRFDEYSEKEFCMAMNMLYSDLCEVNRAYISPDKEAQYYAKCAQAWLEDDDGPAPSEKLALYFYCISDDE